ncbi:MAG: hypothetical protein HYZ71_14315 [Deltaproteobacteria bacterium]|nr:hypothetical protein [Deltaproteobacteria bacterium]
MKKKPGLSVRVGSRIQWEAKKASLHFQRWRRHKNFAAPGEGVTLFFVPEAGLKSHMALLCVLAKTLEESGQRTLFVQCLNHFERCPVKSCEAVSAHPSAKLIEQLCYGCLDTSMEMLNAYRLSSVSLEAYRDAEMEAQINQALSSAGENLMRFTYQNIEFGSLCSSDLILDKKLVFLERVEGENREVWLQYIRATIRAFLLTERMLAVLPVKQLVHYNEYCLAMGPRLAAAAKGIPGFTVTHAAHRNVDRSKVVITSKLWGGLMRDQTDAWRVWGKLSIPRPAIDEVATDVLSNMLSAGWNIYSPKKTFYDGDLRERLGLSPDRKLIVAYTSSPDELVGIGYLMDVFKEPHDGGLQPFEDQVEWLKALAAFVSTREDMQLVIRVHPREGKNKRTNLRSEHLEQLETAFASPPRHCRIVWPEDPISSYDLGEIADVALTAWSNIVMELARLGVPSVVAFHNAFSPVPNEGLMRWARDPAEYFRLLVEMTQSRTTLQNVTDAFRWYYMARVATALDIGDVVPSAVYEGLPQWRRPKESEAVVGAIIRGDDVLRNYYEGRKREDGTEAQRVEAEAVLAAMSKFVHFFLTGEGGEVDPTGLTISGYKVRYVTASKTVQRYSPLCARLGRVLLEVDKSNESSLRRAATV